MGNKVNRTHPEEEVPSYGYDYGYDQRDDYDSGWYPEKDYGKPYYPEANAPIIKRKRSCTDVICFLLFLAFLGGWAFVAFLGFRGGNIDKVIYPTDSQGNICGRGEMHDRKLLLLFDLTQCLNPGVLVEGCLTPQVCVNHCPDTNYSPRVAAGGRKLFQNGTISARNVFGSIAQGVGSLAGAIGATEDEETIKAKMEPYCKKKEFLQHREKDVNFLIDHGVCPPWWLKSTDVLGRCIPVDIKQDNDTQKVLVKVNKENKDTLDPVPKNELEKGMHRFGAFMAVRNFGERIFSDLKATYWMIGLALIGACIISFLWIILMRFLAGVMIYTSILAVFIGVGGLLGYSGYTLYFVWQSTDPETHKHIYQLNWTPDILDDFLKQKDTWLAFTSVTGIIFLVILCLFIFLWQRIRIAIALIEQGSKAVGQMFSSLFFPIIPFLLQLVVVAWFLLVALFLASWGIPENRVSFSNPDAHNPSSPSECINSGACTFINSSTGQDVVQNFKPGDICDPETFNKSCTCKDVECQFVRYSKNQDYSWMQFVNVFGLYWGVFFFTAFGELVLAGVFSEWYWTMNKKKLVSCSLGSAMWNATVYHLGTIAFGSLIIAIIRMIKTILEYVEKKCKRFNNDLTRCLLCACKCCLWCLEKFMRFINRNAYIMCAVKSSNFCKSAKDAFNLLMRNLVRVVVLDGVVDFLLFLGKLVIVLITGAVSYLAFAGQIPEIKNEIPSLNYFYTPIVFIVVGSYFIAKAFFDVYAMAVDTLFLCFLEDLERNDGSLERPYYMSSGLRNILGKMQQVARDTRYNHHGHY